MRRRAAALLLFLTLAAAQPNADELLAEGRKLASAAATRKQAVARLESAANLYRAQNNNAGLAQALLALGRALEMLRDYEPAEKHLREVLFLQPDNAGAWHGIGNIQMARGEAPDALASYEKALALSKDRFQQAILLNNIAASHWSTGEAARALDEYQKVLEIRRELNDRPGIGYSLYGIAISHYSMGAYQESLEAHREALAIWRETKNPAGEANSLNSIGLLLAGLGDRAAARLHYEQALALSKSPYTVNNLALLDSSQGSETLAIQGFERALSALRELGDKRGEAYVLHNLGNSYGNLGQNDKAIRFYLDSLAIKRSISDRYGEAYTLHNLGESYRVLGRISDAREHFQQALELRENIGDRTGQRNSLAGLAWCARADRDFETAYSLISRALDLVEVQRSELLSQDLRITWLASNRTLYEFAVELLADMGKTDKAFEMSERARARALLDALAETVGQIRRGVPADLLQKERLAVRELNARADRLQRLFSSSANPTESAAARRQFERALLSLAEAQDSVRAASPSYASLIRPKPSNINEIRALLPEGTALIEFFVSKTRVFAWFLSKKSLLTRTFGPRKTLESDIRRWQQAVMSRSASEAAPRLARQIFGDWLKGARRIVLVPDGPLESVPFAALVPPNVELTRAPSASAVAALSPQKRAPRELAVIADPVYQVDDTRVKSKAQRLLPDYPRLRFSRLEAEQIARLTPSAENLVALDFEARKSLLDRLGEYRRIHIAAHGVADTERPALSGLVLSRLASDGGVIDGHIRLHEIYNLSLRADLVVLSACETAVGKEFAGEGLAALTRGFLHAGARRVVASLWSVQDRATAEFMSRFYEGLLRKRLSAAAALNYARTEMARHPRWRSPYYWAGFTLTGDWR